MNELLSKELNLLQRYRASLRSRHATRANHAASELLTLLHPLLLSVALKYKTTTNHGGLHSEEDLYRLAQMGALKAFKSYDPTRSSSPNAFPRHVYVRAENAIKNELYRQHQVHLSNNDARKRNRTPAPPAPSLIAIPDLAGDPTDPDANDDLLGTAQRQAAITTGEPDQTPEFDLIQQERANALRMALAALNPHRKKLLEDIFGLNGDKPRKVPESKRKTYRRALNQLRELITAEFTEHFEALFDPEDPECP